MQQDQDSELKVFISSRDSVCDECHEKLGHQAWITLVQDKRALCLACADLDHLTYLASGDAALTRRARKYSTLAAVVLKWSRSRKRYERQGLLVEEDALTKAEEECLADFDLRARRKAREAERRETEDLAFQAQFAQRLRELFPGCPAGREQKIAEHACLKYSGRVGRSAAAKQLDEAAIRLAVIAHIRHRETRYDDLLMRGYDRSDARAEIQKEVTQILHQWNIKESTHG
jgi:hypothetical protein